MVIHLKTIYMTGKDYTGYIPFILFAIFAGIVAYAIIKGTKKKSIKEEPSQAAL
jgi:hypothetical protein